MLVTITFIGTRGHFCCIKLPDKFITIGQFELFTIYGIALYRTFRDTVGAASTGFMENSMSEKMKNRWGAIFDWDGVIVDSKRLHEEAWNRIAGENNFSHTHEDFERHFGMKGEQAISNVLRWSQDADEIQWLGAKKEEHYRRLLHERDITPIEGVKQWLAILDSASVPCAVASSTPLENISSVIEKVGVKQYFSTVVSGDDVSCSKPDPEVFLLAAKRLKMEPRYCLVFEDAPAGIAAALAAKMKVIAVPTTHAKDSLRKADRVVERLDELKVDEINQWFDGVLPSSHNEAI